MGGVRLTTSLTSTPNALRSNTWSKGAQNNVRLEPAVTLKLIDCTHIVKIMYLTLLNQGFNLVKDWFTCNDGKHWCERDLFWIMFIWETEKKIFIYNFNYFVMYLIYKSEYWLAWTTLLLCIYSSVTPATNRLNEGSFYHMSLWAGLEYADDHVMLQCVKEYIPAEQKQE